jgi:hypothetical protein
LKAGGFFELATDSFAGTAVWEVLGHDVDEATGISFDWGHEGLCVLGYLFYTE